MKTSVPLTPGQTCSLGDPSIRITMPSWSMSFSPGKIGELFSNSPKMQPTDLQLYINYAGYKYKNSYIYRPQIYSFCVISWPVQQLWSSLEKQFKFLKLGLSFSAGLQVYLYQRVATWCEYWRPSCLENTRLRPRSAIFNCPLALKYN